MSKNNWIIRIVEKSDFMRIVKAYHYAIVMPRITKHYVGCFEGNRLIGGMSLGWGTQPKKTIQKLFPMLDTIDYLEIGKMVMLDEMPRNSETQMISLIIKWIKKNLKIKFLFTWSDGIQGKPGYVYQAANFYYGGFIWTDIYEKNGEKIHPRSAKPLLIDNAKMIGVDKLFWLTYEYCKKNGIRRIKGKQFRYIYPLNRQATKLLKKSTVKWLKKMYPKAVDLVWKIQVAKGKYEILEIKPELYKNVINVNHNNVKWALRGV